VDKKLDRKRLAVLTAAGLAVATMCAGVAFAFSGNDSEHPKRDTVPVGQLVEVPTSSAPTNSTEPQAVATDPTKKDTAAVPNQPAPQTVQQPAPANEPTNTPPPATTMPTGENGAPLNPAPAPAPPPPAGNPGGYVPEPNPTAPTTR
jgi:hypothetical protein